MRLLISLLLSSLALHAQQIGYAVSGNDAGPWTEILSSVGLFAKTQAEAAIFVARPGTPADAAWPHRVETGGFLILEGDSPLARSFGFRLLDRTTRMASVIDTHQPETPLIFEHPIELSESALPDGTQIFARERWTNVPVIAGFRRGNGAVLWVATNPGKHGYERFPFIASALTDLGFELPFRGNRLWAFFDYAYRARVDVNWFAKRWHQSGIAALQVAAWHFYEADPEKDKYLNSLIEACHREGILVYAWLELPHVSEQFWADHPEWREKTALLQDAHLDWRKLMNLANPACAKAVHDGIRGLTRRFDWDGVNFAELYYESLEGAANPARFTPLNDDVRRKFQSTKRGFDPIELWSSRKDPGSLRAFLDFRAGLARDLQEEWLAEAESYRAFRPELDIVLTHVDDRLDTKMHDAIGADTSHLTSLLAQHHVTFLVEDPATVWDQGPQRYPLIASKYPKTSNVAIDINVVERYQDVYPTKQQTGAELFGLVHLATQSFGRVAVYIENSLTKPDLNILSSAAADFTQADWVGPRLTVTNRLGGGVRCAFNCSVDGKPWPVQEAGTMWLPPGSHVLERSSEKSKFLLLSTSGSLAAAAFQNDAIRFSYESNAREIARFNLPVRKLVLDGQALPASVGLSTILLPRGNHTVIAWPQADESGSKSRGNSGQTVFSNRGSQ